MPALLELAEVSVHFGGVAAVDRVSLSLAPGEIAALIGPNGAGKTTLFNAIAGNAPVSSGTIRFRGEAIENRSPHDIAQLGIRRTFQNGGLFPDLSVIENVLAGLHTEIASGFLGLLFAAGPSRRSEREAAARARALLERMGIGALAEQSAGGLSGGQQRMVEILRAVAPMPPLLLLDEPAVGLAPPARAALATLVRRLARENGIGVLLIEHAIELVMQLADRVVVLSDGAKVADGAPQAVRADRAVLEAYLGHA
jgi:branched-chain amino acid transport system ATP-binding protein